MTLKIGFIGTGGIAQNHLQNLRQISGVTVSAFCDIQLDRAEQAAKQWNDARAYDNMQNMLDDRKLDAVYICVPPMAHGEAENSVADRGIPFLVEKPLAIDNDLPRAILNKVEQQKLITSVGFHWRYLDVAVKARSIIQETKLGMALGYWMGGMPMVPWWRLQNGSGGQFVEQTTHITDLLRYLCGEVVEVYAAYGQRVMHEQVEGTTVADVGSVTMKLESGAVATISNTCLLPIGHHVGLDLYTEQGVLEVRGNSLKELNRDKVTEYKNMKSGYLVEDEVFIDAVRTKDGSKILSPYADAIITHEITTAANRSAETGLPVKLR